MTEALPTIPAGKYCFITPEIKKKISFTSVFYQSSWFHIQDSFFFLAVRFIHFLVSEDLNVMSSRISYYKHNKLFTG